jgi:excisionase family DNA binding protein
VFELFKNILRNLSAGKAVSIVPYDAELTTHQAAHFLNVSRPFLIKLLEAGEIPHHKVGTHRRVQFDHLLAYKKQQKDRTKKSLKKLTGLSQEYGLY